MKPRFRLTLKTIRRTCFFITALLIAGFIGYRLGLQKVTVQLTDTKKLVINRQSPPTREVDFALFWDVWERLEQKYIDKSKLNPQNMVYGAIFGMVNALEDPYTIFLTPEENEEYKQELDGTFEGIGAQLGSKDDRIVVVTPLKNHPAEKAGLKAGDWIAKVDGVDTIGWTVIQAVTEIRGPKGSKVILTIAREGFDAPMDIEIIRDTIIVKSVEMEIKSLDECEIETCPQIAYIRLSKFGDRTNDEWNSTVTQIRNELLYNSNFKGVVLDVRNNPGGYLQSSVYVASEFIRSGVVVVQENSDGTRETHSVTRVGSMLDVPLVVLINKGSASAAEIVAGALRDYERASLVGENTFGKGSIQTPEDLSDGSGLHITTARWILPDGDWINDTGIAPDIEVENDLDATDSADLQLERAMKELGL